MNGNLLFEERPLLIIPSLAKLIGLHESIILQQIHYWLKRTNHIQMDRKWVYFTYDDFTEQFPFFSKSTIRRLITNLENKGLLSSNHFNRLKIDRTKWYTINYDNLENLKTNEHPHSEVDILSSSHNEQTMCSNQTNDLLNLDNPCVQNEQTSCSNWTEDVLNLDQPLLESTSKSTAKNTSEISSSSKNTPEKVDPFRFFEQNGFGTIGSFIADKIKVWCTDLSDSLVTEAMKLAVENSSKRWSYVEAILRDWVDKGYQTIEDVHAARLIYKNQMNQQSMKKPTRQEYIPDWFQEHVQNDKPKNTSTLGEKWLVDKKLKNLTEQENMARQELTTDTSFEKKKRLFEERLMKS
ncbi:DnaD domain protein [Bacillus sp. HNG]|uniref:DnaD domain-containing protein n=1 Tax=Bacillus sp. HNG TaxID=2293325 RepID=UPI000E2EEEE1|nr:DnaD domain protein [Bacillus sp. HNG]RFB17418.1 DnaD domain protein [Bacillus sp. HNG]